VLSFRASIYFIFSGFLSSFIIKLSIIETLLYCLLPGLPSRIPVSMFTSVVTDLTKARLKRQPDIQLDGGACWITDMMVVTPDTLLVSNNGRKCVQLVDSRNGRVLDEVQLKDAPYQICLTDRNTAAVNVGEKTIQMIQMKDKTLTLGKVLTVSNVIHGITSSRNSLVVSYDRPPWLEVVSMDGKVIHQFDGKSKHFISPCFTCTTPKGSVLISDYGANTITKVDTNLDILQTFNSPLLQVPRGITSITEDQILVCSHNNHRILLLQPSSETMRTLLGEDDGIFIPYSLAYCPDQKKVFVASQQASKPIQVYQIM